jgi:hypothetical protein
MITVMPGSYGVACYVFVLVISVYLRQFTCRKPKMTDASILPEALRRRAVAAAIGLTANTPLSPKRYERVLLHRFQAGEISLEQMADLLDTSTFHILYRSQAIGHPTRNELQAILDWSIAYNAQHQLTGLLLYSDQQFVQLLEGPEAAVRLLYARIQQDTRHAQIVTLSDGPGPARLFAEWQMAFGYVSFMEMQLVRQAVERQALPPVSIDDPRLQILLAAFARPESGIEGESRPQLT